MLTKKRLFGFFGNYSVLEPYFGAIMPVPLKLQRPGQIYNIHINSVYEKNYIVNTHTLPEKLKSAILSLKGGFMPGTLTELICPDCGKHLTVDNWGYQCECNYRQRHQPDPTRTTCPIDGTELTNDITRFDQPADQNVMTWHRLHYHDYLDVKDHGKRFCPECLWTEP